jgi:hypothetical protein
VDQHFATIALATPSPPNLDLQLALPAQNINTRLLAPRPASIFLPALLKILLLVTLVVIQSPASKLSLGFFLLTRFAS